LCRSLGVPVVEESLHQDPTEGRTRAWGGLRDSPSVFPNRAGSTPQATKDSTPSPVLLVLSPTLATLHPPSNSFDHSTLPHSSFLQVPPPPLPNLLVPLFFTPQEIPPVPPVALSFPTPLGILKSHLGVSGPLLELVF